MLALTDAQRALAARDDGPGMAMRILAGSAGLLGAPALIAIESAHIDGCLYHGDSGALFAEALVRGGARVGVPSTLNVGALDLLRAGNVRLAGPRRAMAMRLMRAYEAMGCKATWTCAPYQAGHRPAVGAQVAWGESNAVAFCNSVLGARTNRYGDFLDIACAICGLAPDHGLHRAGNRRARILVDLAHLPARLRGADEFWPVLGAWHGREVGGDVAVIEGLAGFTSEDRLKAFAAAAASSGATALFHVAGVTPEAPDAATALGGEPPERRLAPDLATLRQARDGLSTAAGGQVDAAAVGSPHLSAAECAETARLFAGRRARVPFYVCTGRHTIREIEGNGVRGDLEAAGVAIVADTCVVVTPILADMKGTLVTNSGKFAHYAPGNTGYATLYGSLADCVESAVAGRLVRDEGAWT